MRYYDKNCATIRIIIYINIYGNNENDHDDIFIILIFKIKM